MNFYYKFVVVFLLKMKLKIKIDKKLKNFKKYC